MDYLGYGGSGVDLLVRGAQFTVGAIKNSGQHKAAYEASKFLKNNFFPAESPVSGTPRERK